MLLFALYYGLFIIIIMTSESWKKPSLFKGFPGGSDGKESACSAGDLGLIPGLEDPLEKGMATCSSTLAWRISWTEKPDGLQSMELQGVRHD